MKLPNAQRTQILVTGEDWIREHNWRVELDGTNIKINVTCDNFINYFLVDERLASYPERESCPSSSQLSSKLVIVTILGEIRWK